MLTGQPRFQSGWQVLRVGLILGNGQHVHTHTHTPFSFSSLFFFRKPSLDLTGQLSAMVNDHHCHRKLWRSGD